MLPPPASQPHVKVCGIARSEDALLAARLGASLIGLIFAAESPRRVNSPAAAAILAELRAGTSPNTPAPVGVFVHEPLSEILALARDLHLAAIQLHREPEPDLVAGLARENVVLIRAFRVKGPQDQPAILHALREGPVLLDTFVEGQHGGTGKTFDHTLALPALRAGRVLIAGGLRPENIGTIAAALRPSLPYAFDVSSGLEASPGVKDPAKLQAFFHNLRAALAGMPPA